MASFVCEKYGIILLYLESEMDSANKIKSTKGEILCHGSDDNKPYRVMENMFTIKSFQIVTCDNIFPEVLLPHRDSFTGIRTSKMNSENNEI